MKRPPVTTERGHQESEPEGERRQGVRQVTEQRGPDAERTAVFAHHRDPQQELAHGLPAAGVKHGGVESGEEQREGRDQGRDPRILGGQRAGHAAGGGCERRLDQDEQRAVDQRRGRAGPAPRRGRRFHRLHALYNTRMISVQDGQTRILAQIAERTPPEVIPLVAARGRVLAEPVYAPFDVPPTDNSAVDGYAVTSADIPAEGWHELTVVADLPAGTVYAGVLQRGQTIRIMTGAPMPAGADTVYPQEEVERCGDRVRVGPLLPGANVRRRGEDVQAGAVVIEAGTVLRPQELGLIASLGQSHVVVHQRPRVAVLSTGDEVAEPGGGRKPGQIYDANRFTLRALVEQCGGVALDLGIVPDQRELLRTRLLEATACADVVVTSGGVSVGAYDLVKDVLGELGGIDFWQVAMQPGRPLAVGRIGHAHFFGLPGNPVASMLTFLIFVRPALWALAGRKRLFPETWEARAVEPMRKKPGRREFKRGVLRFTRDGWEVRTTGPQGSGILSSLVAGNCLIILEEERGDVAPGEIVTVEPLSQEG